MKLGFKGVAFRLCQESHFSFASSLPYLMMASFYLLRAQTLNLHLQLLNMLIYHTAASLP